MKHFSVRYNKLCRLHVCNELLEYNHNVDTEYPGQSFASFNEQP